MGLFQESLEIDMISSGVVAGLLNLKNLWPRFGSAICGERKQKDLRDRESNG